MSRNDFLNRLESLAEENENDVTRGTAYGSAILGGKRRKRRAPKKGGEIVGGEMIGGEIVGGKRRRKTKKGGKTDVEKLIEKEERIKMLEGQAVRLKRKIKKSGGYTTDSELYESLKDLTGGVAAKGAAANPSGSYQQMINFLRKDEVFEILGLNPTTYGTSKNKLILRLMDDNLEGMDQRTRELYEAVFNYFYDDYAGFNPTTLSDALKKRELRENKIVKNKEMTDHQIKKILKLYPGVTKEHIRIYKDLNELLPPRA